jgi:hypothetical protein
MSEVWWAHLSLIRLKCRCRGCFPSGSLGQNPFPCSSVPCGCTTEIPFPWWLSLKTLSFQRLPVFFGPWFCFSIFKISHEWQVESLSCFNSLLPLLPFHFSDELAFFLFLRAHVMTLSPLENPELSLYFMVWNLNSTCKVSLPYNVCVHRCDTKGWRS